MRLSRIFVSNYKSIPADGVTLEFRANARFLVLVGKNNAGKSNLLEAISLILGQTSVWRLSFLPSVYNDPSKPIVIEAELADSTFGDGKGVGFSDPQCHALMRAAKTKESYPGRILFHLTVPQSLEPEDEEAEQEPEKRTFQLLINQSEIRRKADEFRRRLVRYLAVPTLRSYSDLLSPSAWTPYGRLLRDLLAESGKTGELVELIDQATQRLREILKDEAALLTHTAKATAYVDEIGFNLTKDNDPAELLRNLSLSVTYGGRSEDIARVGTGTQSAVIIGVLELCLRHAARAGVRLFSVEEPELFLHPQAQRYVSHLLRSIAADERSYVVLTTHSSAIVANSDLLDVVRVERDDQSQTRCIRLPANYDGLEQSERIIGTDTAEALFADMVVFVEGPSEAAVLPFVGRLTKTADGRGMCDFNRLNISVLDVGGKGEFTKYTALFGALQISWRVIADRDALDDGSLKCFYEHAGIEEQDDFESRHKKLRSIGVAVLAEGEIEDYYPAKALAELANCKPEELEGVIDQHREYSTGPEQADVVWTVIGENRKHICDAEKAPFG